MQTKIAAVEPSASDLTWFYSLVESIAQYGFWVPAGAVLLLGLVVGIYRGTFTKLMKHVFGYLKREQDIEAAEVGVELKDEGGCD